MKKQVHPNKRKSCISGRRTCLRELLVVVAVAFGQMASAADEAAVTADRPAVAAVRTTRLVQRQMGTMLDAWGMVGANAKTIQNLSPAVAGEVVRLKVVSGQAVKKGECVLTYKTAPEVMLAWQQARQALAFAQGERQRTASLQVSGLATVSQLAAADRALQDARQSVAALRQQGADQPIIQLCAPFDGWVQQVLVSTGQRVAAGTPLLVLAPATHVIASLAVEPAAAVHLRSGDQVQLDGMLEGGQASGRVQQVASAVNPQTRMVDVLVSCPTGAFVPGEAVHGRLMLGPHLAWVVPRSAVLSDADGSYLFQIEQGHAHRIAVQVGDESGDLLEVSGHFNVNAPVVVTGNAELDEGMAVRGESR